MDVLNMKPVKAFLYQDHAAHIQVHMSAMQDPEIMKLIGQNPQAQQMMGAMMAHIAEHTGFAYRQRIEQVMGIQLPAEDEEMSPQMERQVSAIMAQAAQMILQQNQAKAAQEQAQQMQQDPIVQMQQQELQLKSQELAIKEKKIATDAAAKADELALKNKQIELDAAFKAGKLKADQTRDGARIGVDIAKSRMQAMRPGPKNRGE